MREKFIITFAGPMGSSKTPIAYYLSWKLDLPIFSNDSIRSEVMAELGVFDEQEYEKRRDERSSELVKKGVSFIYDASIDREWGNFKDHLDALNYEPFIISMDLDKAFLISLYNHKVALYKGTSEYPERIDKSIGDHRSFLERYGDKVDLHIDEENFPDRMRLSYEKAREWIDGK